MSSDRKEKELEEEKKKEKKKALALSLQKKIIGEVDSRFSQVNINIIGGGGEKNSKDNNSDELDSTPTRKVSQKKKNNLNSLFSSDKNRSEQIINFDENETGEVL